MYPEYGNEVVKATRSYMSSRFSINSKKFLRNYEAMFPLYYMHSIIYSRFEYLNKL